MLRLLPPVLVLSYALLPLQVQANNPNGLTPWALHNNNLQSHIQKWNKDPDGTAREYGHISKWDLSNVTSLRNLFAFNEEFNEDISQWNVSAVTDFSSMFWEADSFDRNLGQWDVRAAQTMACMFCGASSFRGEGLEQWKDRLSNVQDMFNMFEGSALETDLNDWDVHNVSNFRQMFMDLPHYEHDICWDVRLGARTTDMFNGTPACFKKSCVREDIYEEAGCSAGLSWMTSTRVSSTWLVFMSLSGIVSLGYLF